jgi:hypothetical protein
MVAAVLCAGLALLIPVEFLSLLFLAPLAFFLPGYAILAAALPARPQGHPQTLVLSVGLSLAVLAIGGIPLNYLGGLTPGGWALLLVLVVLLGVSVAARRRPESGAASSLRSAISRPSLGAAALLAAALLLIVAAVVIAFVPLTAKHAIGYSELWLRPYSGPGVAGVRIGVGNQEKDSTEYVVRTRFGARPQLSRTRIVLAPGERTTIRVPALPPPRLRPTLAVVQLFLAGEPDRPYRQVYDWVSAPGETDR